MPRSSDSASVPGPVETVDPESRGRFMLIANAIALLTLCVVTFAHPSASRMHSWPWSAVVMALWLFPVAALMIGMERRQVWRMPRPLVLSGIGLLAIGAFASAV